jgi:hypothetical protein
MTTHFHVLTKAEKFVLNLMQHTPNIPKYYRQTFAYKLDECGVQLILKLTEARYAISKDKQECLKDADLTVSKIRVLLRLSYELKCISIGLLEELSLQLNEIGKMLGGLKQNDQEKS